MSTTHDNRENGKLFEILFERTCMMSGMWAEKNHLKAQRVWKGRLEALPSNLDYQVVAQGRMGHFDCKSFDGSWFTYSQIKDHQRELAAKYNRWGIPSGFVVFFRERSLVVFFSGAYIAQAGPGSRFGCDTGQMLGKWDSFDPRLILETPSTP